MSPEYFEKFLNLCKVKGITFPNEEAARESAEKLLKLMRVLMESDENE
jgi:hypothetical protein